MKETMRKYTFVLMLLDALRNMEEHGLAHNRPQDFWEEEMPPNYFEMRFRDLYGRVPGERFIQALSKELKTTRIVKEFVETALKGERSWHGLMARLLLHLWEEHRKILDSKVLGKDFDKKRAREVYASLCWLAGEIEDIMPGLRPGYGPEGYETVGLPEREFEEHMRVLSENLHRLREKR